MALAFHEISFHPHLASLAAGYNSGSGAGSASRLLKVTTAGNPPSVQYIQMDAFQRVRRRSQIKGMKPVDEKRRATALVSEEEFDVSGRTVDADASHRSIPEPAQCRQAEVVGDASCLAGRLLKSCMKIRTQRDSLAMISQVNLPSAQTPTIKEAADVRFDTVEFRHHTIILSDNPSTSSGPAIGIGWSYDPSETITLDVGQYEDEREGSRRSKKEIIVPKHLRERRLREAGYSRSEIASATRSADRSKAQRRSSQEMQKFEPLLEKVETMKRMLPRRRSSGSDSLG